MSYFWRVASTSKTVVVPLLSVTTAASIVFLDQTRYNNNNNHGRQRRQSVVRCDAADVPAQEEPKLLSSILSKVKGKDDSATNIEEGMRSDVTGIYHGMFPLRQLWIPALEYPLWNKNWDGRHPEPTGDIDEDRRMMRQLRKEGVTRHIILVRHGQYDETHKEDEKRILTPLGRIQAHYTGKRIAEMIRGAENDFGPCNVTKLRVSGLVRAQETAEIIASHLPNNITVDDPDPMINEGRPCHTIPGGAVSDKLIELTDHHHPRIEEAYKKYFYRAPMPTTTTTNLDENNNNNNKHEFEIIVCHANVIRYWMCRALQLPPETWLRFCPFNCSLTYITIRPTGTVSCRMLGDIGHLPYNASTFSGHHGYNW